MRILPALPIVLLAAACGTDSADGTPVADPPPPAPSTASDPIPSPTATTTAGTRHDLRNIDQPPPFRLRHDGQELAIHPTTYCYDGGCVDGVTPNPPDIGSPEEILVYVPVEGFDLSVYAQEVTREPDEADPFADITCGGRSFEVPVEDRGEGWYAVRHFGPAARYTVQLFAHGDGDMVADLRWRMPADGAMPEPSARLALIADHDGEPDSYGLELAISDLAVTPERADAEIEVTAGNGRSLTFRAAQSRDRCRSEGDLYFDRPDGPAVAASRLGGFPFTTTVTLTLDGRSYRATAVYPDDEIRGDEPSVALDFQPALPGPSS